MFKFRRRKFCRLLLCALNVHIFPVFHSPYNFRQLPPSQVAPRAQARAPAPSGLASRGLANTNNANSLNNFNNNNNNNNFANAEAVALVGNQRTRARNGVLGRRLTRASANNNNFRNGLNTVIDRSAQFAGGQRGARNSIFAGNSAMIDPFGNSANGALNRNAIYATNQRGSLARNSVLPSSQGSVMVRVDNLANSQADLLNRNAILSNSRPEFLGGSGGSAARQSQPLLNSAVGLADVLNGQTAAGGLANNQADPLLNTGNTLALNSQILPNSQQELYLNRGSLPAEPLNSQGPLSASPQIP